MALGRVLSAPGLQSLRSGLAILDEQAAASASSSPDSGFPVIKRDENYPTELESYQAKNPGHDPVQMIRAVIGQKASWRKLFARGVEVRITVEDWLGPGGARVMTGVDHKGESVIDYIGIGPVNPNGGPDALQASLASLERALDQEVARREDSGRKECDQSVLGGSDIAAFIREIGRCKVNRLNVLDDPEILAIFDSPEKFRAVVAKLGSAAASDESPLSYLEALNLFEESLSRTCGAKSRGGDWRCQSRDALESEAAQRVLPLADRVLADPEATVAMKSEVIFALGRLGVAAQRFDAIVDLATQSIQDKKNDLVVSTSLEVLALTLEEKRKQASPSTTELLASPERSKRLVQLGYTAYEASKAEARANPARATVRFSEALTHYIESLDSTSRSASARPWASALLVKIATDRSPAPDATLQLRYEAVKKLSGSFAGTPDQNGIQQDWAGMLSEFNPDHLPLQVDSGEGHVRLKTDLPEAEALRVTALLEWQRELFIQVMGDSLSHSPETGRVPVHVAANPALYNVWHNFEAAISPSGGGVTIRNGSAENIYVRGQEGLKSGMRSLDANARHEYTHAMAFSLLSRRGKPSSPFWWQEGIAEFMSGDIRGGKLVPPQDAVRAVKYDRESSKGMSVAEILRSIDGSSDGKNIYLFGRMFLHFLYDKHHPDSAGSDLFRDVNRWVFSGYLNIEQKLAQAGYASGSLDREFQAYLDQQIAKSAQIK